MSSRHGWPLGREVLNNVFDDAAYGVFWSYSIWGSWDRRVISVNFDHSFPADVQVQPAQQTRRRPPKWKLEPGGGCTLVFAVYSFLTNGRAILPQCGAKLVLARPINGCGIADCPFQRPCPGLAGLPKSLSVAPCCPHCPSVNAAGMSL